MSEMPFAAGAQLGLLAATPVAGVALVNGTPVILTWTAPADGQQHRFQVIFTMDVTVATTGGQININWTMPDGTATSFALQNGTIASTGWNSSAYGGVTFQSIARPGSAVTVTQATALTAGAARLWAELWGS